MDSLFVTELGSLIDQTISTGVTRYEAATARSRSHGGRRHRHVRWDPDAAASVTAPLVSALRGVVLHNVQHMGEAFHVLRVRLDAVAADMALRGDGEDDVLVLESGSDADSSGGDDVAAPSSEASRIHVGDIELLIRIRLLWGLLVRFLLDYAPVSVQLCRGFLARWTDTTLPWRTDTVWCEATVVASLAVLPLQAATQLRDRAARRRLAVHSALAARAEQRREHHARRAEQRRRCPTAAEEAKFREAVRLLAASLSRSGANQVPHVKREVKAEGGGGLGVVRIPVAPELAHVGASKDAAIDADEDYEPTYVQGATRTDLRKLEPPPAPLEQKPLVSAGRREPRVRPR